MNTVLGSSGRLLAIGFALLIPLAASASPITAPAPPLGFPTVTVRGLTGTGMASPGVAFVQGSIDTHWTHGYRTTLGPTPGNMNNTMSVMTHPLPTGWVGNTARSQWIQPTGTNSSDGFYYYQARFDLTEQNLSTFELAFRMTADDEIACVVLNDWITPYTAESLPGDPVHGRWSDVISIGNDDRPGLAPAFFAGENTLTFVVRNNDRDDAGLQVQFGPFRGPGAVPNPEPMTLALFGALSVAGLIGARRRSRTA